MRDGERTAMGETVSNNPADRQQVASAANTIRFPQVDPAGIVFYPRYFEMVARSFPWLSLDRPPFGIETRFLKPNRLGDQLTLKVESGADCTDWSVSGVMSGDTYFSMCSTRESFTADASIAGATFETAEFTIGDWCAGANGRLQLSRSFELLNVAIEEWFEESLGLEFHALHVGRKVGIPTAQFRTSVRNLPKSGSAVTIRIRPTNIGNRSMRFTSWLVSGTEWQIRNEQVIVFVRMLDDSYELMHIPDEIRQPFSRQLDDNR